MESGANGGRDRLLARYRTERKIGEGAFGAVFRARDLQTGELVAVKRVRLRDTRNLPVNALRELSVLRRLEHPNVLALLDVRTDGASLALVTPFLPASLAAVLQQRDMPLPRRTAARTRGCCSTGWRRCTPSGSCTATSSRRTC